MSLISGDGLQHPVVRNCTGNCSNVADSIRVNDRITKVPWPPGPAPTGRNSPSSASRLTLRESRVEALGGCVCA